MKIGYFGKQNSFALEMLRRLKLEHSRDEFLTRQPGNKAPSTELEVIIAFGKVDSKDIEAQTKLGLLQMASAGYEGVDVDAATKAGVSVGSAPTTKTGNGESVAEVLMLAVSRRPNEELAFTQGSVQNRSEKWEVNRGLSGKTACIVGLGGIGDLLIERLRGFGMILTGVDKNPEHAPNGVRGYRHDELKAAAAEADYLVLAIPGTRENENMIDRTVLAGMKKNSVLINVARGTLVDEAALLAAVKSGHLYGAGLDVVRNEPVSEGNPLLMEPRIFVTRHIAGSTDLMLDGTVKYLGEVLARYRDGLQSDGLINEPTNPRVPLRESLARKAFPATRFSNRRQAEQEGSRRPSVSRLSDYELNNTDDRTYLIETPSTIQSPRFEEFQMTQSKATRSIIDTHRHIFGPKLRQKFVENIGFDDSKPLPQANAGEMFFYRESVDVDYSMEIQRQSGVTVCVNSYGGEIETFAQHIIKASTIDTLKFLHDESFELRDRFPKDIACMANAHALEENTRDVIDPLISNKEACCISISTSYGSGPEQIFLDSPKAEWLWEYAQDKDVLVHIHPPLVSIGAAAMQQYRLIEAVGRPFDTALSAARMIYSGVFDKYPKLKVLFVHMGGALAPVVCRLDWNWDLNYKGIQTPPIQKVDKNLRKPSEYFKSNIYVDTMGPSAICLKAMIEMCGVDRVLFGTDFGPVPMSPKLHIDLVDDTITDAADRKKIFSTNTLAVLRLAESAPRLVPRAA